MQVGRFECKERLGSGGYGDVWKAWDPSVGRWVALKLLKGADDPERRARFEREAHLAAALEHPGIAGIFEVGEHDGRPFLAMQFVPGVSLSGWKGDPREAARIIEDAARAVHFANGRAVIHRDLKPANIMLGESGRVFVLDFGLARPLDAPGLTASGMVVGTPSYMAPEQARGEATEARADVYALGATLYELLTGRVPFEASNVLDTLMKVIEEDAVAPRRLNPSVSPELEAITQRCLEKEPSRRYRSAGALADDLARWRAGEPIEARPPSLRQRLGRVARRRRALVIAASIVVVLTAVLVIGLRQRTGDAATARGQLVALMRTTSKSRLDSILDRRRAGSIPEAGEARQIVEICERVIKGLPELAEPHYLLGRLRRAEIDDAAALTHQEAALARDPGVVEARYEHAVLVARKLWARIEALDRRHEWTGTTERKAAEVTFAGLRAAVKEDAAAQALIRTLDADLVLLEKAGIGEGERHCVRGFRAWAAIDDAAVETEFAAAVRIAPLLEEAYEAMALISETTARFADGVRWATEGLARDRGYHPLLRARARLRTRWGDRQRSGSADEFFRPAEEDAVELIRRTKGSLAARTLRGEVLSAWASSVGGPPPEKALVEFDAVLAEDPNYMDAIVARGGLLSDMALDGRRPLQEQFELEKRSERDLTFAIAAGEDRAYTWRGILRWNLAARLTGRGEDASDRLELAQADFSAAVVHHPRDLAGWLYRGFVRMRLALKRERSGGDGRELMEAAFKDLTEAIDIAKRDPEPLTARARAHGLWGQRIAEQGRDASESYDACLRDLDQALELAPRYPTALRASGEMRTRYGIWMQSRGRSAAALFEAAERHLTLAIELDERDPRARMLRGNTRGQLALLSRESDRIFETAIADLTRAVELTAGTEDELLQRAVIRFMWSRRTAARGPELRRLAEADFDEVLRRSPLRVEAWRQRGALLSAIARDVADADVLPVHERAIASCKRATELAPHWADCWTALGAAGVNSAIARMARGVDPIPDFDAAEHALTKGVTLNPNDGQAWEFTGNLHFSRAIYLDWKTNTPHRDLVQRALDAYTKAGEVNPGMKAALKPKMEQCRAKLGE